MSSVFSLMTPMRSLTKYNVDLIDVVDDQAKLMNFLRMEKWLADRPAHPGEAAKQWLKDLYQQNKLVKGSSSCRDVALTCQRSPPRCSTFLPSTTTSFRLPVRRRSRPMSGPRIIPKSRCPVAMSAFSYPASRKEC